MTISETINDKKSMDITKEIGKEILEHIGFDLHTYNALTEQIKNDTKNMSPEQKSNYLKIKLQQEEVREDIKEIIEPIKGTEYSLIFNPNLKEGTIEGKFFLNNITRNGTIIENYKNIPSLIDKITTASNKGKQVFTNKGGKIASGTAFNHIIHPQGGIIIDPHVQWTYNFEEKKLTALNKNTQTEREKTMYTNIARDIIDLQKKIGPQKPIDIYLATIGTGFKLDKYELIQK